MKLKRYIFLLFILSLSLQSFAQDSDIQVLDFEAFKPILTSNSDTTYIVNFWASWCPPCLKEMPAFEEIRQKYINDKVKIFLVSFEFPGNIEKSVLPVIAKYKIGSEVLVLDEPDANSWINKVSPEWTGSIPATLVFNSKSRKFHERSFTFYELDSIVKLNLNQ